MLQVSVAMVINQLVYSSEVMVHGEVREQYPLKNETFMSLGTCACTID